MFFTVAVGANKLKIIKIVVASVSVFVVYLQYFKFTEATPLAIFTPLSQKVDFKCLLSFYFIMRTIDLVFYASSVCVCTTSATRFLVKVR